MTEQMDTNYSGLGVALVNATSQIDTIRAKVIGARERVELPVLADVSQQLKECAALTSDESKVAVRLLKELSRIVIKTVAIAALNESDVNVFIHLDDNLLPAMEIILAVIEKMETSVGEQAAFMSWTPVALYAASFFLCEHLPAHDAMRCTDAAGHIIAASQRIHQKPSVGAVLAATIDRIVSIASQDIAKDEWVAEHSINKHVLEWIVLQVGFPHLGGDVLGRLLALVLPLVDDLNDNTQLPGARMLLQIMKSVTATELRWFTDVILQVLRGATTTRKPVTLNYFVETLVIALDKLSSADEFQHYDLFLPRMLNDCSLATDVEIRLVYTRHLRAVIKRLGAPNSMHIVRYLQPLLKVLVASFDSVRSSLIQETLETLRVTIISAWIRIPHHSEEILVGVLKAVALAEVFPDLGGGGGASQLPKPDEKKHIIDVCEDIVELLHDLDQIQMQKLLKRVVAESSALKPFAARMLVRLTNDLSTVIG